ncbi:heme biosynthesis HemY N-terminal domain-containing protein [Wohlfahrtiimonas larvae]|uniref:Heme biosynthesis protein HemY n=1 Tax=Wohlfahrtiimonas larvae TaxID=1157986 RepID=A0ABP9MHR4_9GAMM|nr:heme biosynthesis HemY N-terminal domain-containing protein [Wohlfahrtiimonas larvae]
MIRFFKASGYFLLLFAIPLFLYFLVKDDPGMVIVTGQNILTQKSFTLMMTLSGFIFGGILFFVVAYTILRFLFKVIGLPQFLKRSAEARSEKSASRKVARAELALLENKPELAEALHLSAVKNSANPSFSYIGAARAAHIQGKISVRDQYLRAVETATDHHNRLHSGIMMGELLNQWGEHEKARTVLERTRKEKGDHYRVLTALAKSYEKLGLYDELLKIMPQLHKSLPKDERLEIEPELYVTLIDHIGAKHEGHELKALWSHIPSNIKVVPSVVVNYAEKLLYAGEVSNAEEALRSSLKKDWNDLVITAYGHLYKGDFNSYIKTAKGFANQHPESAYAALAVARLYYQTKRMEDALEYLQKALQIDNQIPEIHHLLAEILLEKGEFEKSALAFKEAGKLSYAKPSAELLQVEGEVMDHAHEALPESVTNADEQTK